MNLAIGTVQFGMKYGVANAGGQIAPAEGAAILRRARGAGIDTLDTAAAYGNSESCLGEIGVSDWAVVTKLPPFPDEVGDVPAWIRAQVVDSLRRLRVARVDALLLHRSADALGESADSCHAELARLKADGLVRHVGVSIYDPAELEALWPVFRPEVVQAPYNVLDRRIERSGWLVRLARAGVRIHVRSVFLQGLLLMPAPTRPDYFNRWAGVLDAWLRWCDDTGRTPLEASLGFALGQGQIEKVIVGVDGVGQFDEILAAANMPGPRPPESLASEELDLIEPRRWRLH